MTAEWRDLLGLLSVAIAIAAFVIYGWQTLAGGVRPHPLSWTLFGVLSAIGYWVQHDEGVRAGSWALLAMTVICFTLAAASVAKGERSFTRTEWMYLVAGGVVLILYLFTRQATAAAVLTTALDALGYGPTFTRGWTQPRKDSITSFVLNGAKFIPSLAAMSPLTLATGIYPATLLVLNFAVALMLAGRRRRVAA